jgi:hypothetical protein
MRRSLRLLAVNMALRLVVKTALGLIKTPQAMRVQFERDAARFFWAPEDANFLADTIRRPGPDGNGIGNGIGNGPRFRLLRRIRTSRDGHRQERGAEKTCPGHGCIVAMGGRERTFAAGGGGPPLQVKSLNF